MPSIHPLAVACACALGLLLFGLGTAVSLARIRSQRLIGVSDDPDAWLNRLVRAHGNTAEYAPMLALLCLALGMLAPSTPALVAMVLATLARVLFAVGMLTATTLSRPNPIRFAGALGTYVAGVALVVLLALAV
ncbi:MAPEG family protein [Acidovorax lacteus]|uniref:MAPEG family protein n=1 Tax=Acidovorax lacteus TaxID=1924988 RepID=A0ABP8LK32_9BURK